MVEVALNEATGVTVKRVDLRRGCSGSSEKGQLASHVGAVDGEDESPGSWIQSGAEPENLAIGFTHSLFMRTLY